MTRPAFDPIRRGGRSPLGLEELLALLFLSLAGCAIVYLFQPARPGPPPASTPQLRYRVIFENTLGRPVEGLSAWVMAPAGESAYQRCDRLTVDHPHTIIRDAIGNQVIHLPLGRLEPFERRVVAVAADLSLWDTPRPAGLAAPERHLPPEKPMGGDPPPVAQLADRLRGKDPVQTAARIFEWVVARAPSPAAVGPGRGDPHAPGVRTGDGMEPAALFTALCRAAGVPARVVGGFVVGQNAEPPAHAFRYWAEFHHQGAWHPADPERRRFRPPAGELVVMRILDGAGETPLARGERLRVSGEGVVGRFL